jgi:hypothetical protein
MTIKEALEYVIFRQRLANLKVKEAGMFYCPYIPLME